MRKAGSRPRILWALLTITGWVAVAIAGNLAVPQLERVVEVHARSFMPADAPSAVAARQSAVLFGQGPGDNFNYVVLERKSILTDGDRRFYGSLVSMLRSDHSVVSVTDLWGDPITEAAARSADGQAVVLTVRLAGRLGTAEAGGAVTALRADVAALAPPSGLDVYVTGPGATIADEFAAIDRQMLIITAATVALILVLLLLVYRSPLTAAVPLTAVGLALAVARAIVAALGQADVVEVSLFSISLLAAMMLGAGTDYGIFLIGRYHEARRAAREPRDAVPEAWRAVAPVIAGSALTIAVALGALGFAKVGMLRSAGIPSAIGVLVAMAASLTLTPALLAVVTRFGYAEPRSTGSVRRWRRIGATVARWPAPVLVVALGFIGVVTMPLLGMRTGWNEIAATPSSSESGRGYAASDRHFPANRLLPTVVTVVTDHDLRNPAGLIALERITRAVMAIPGVTMVQSASRPAGKVPEEATMTHQAAIVGQQFGASVDQLAGQLRRIGDLDRTLAGMQGVVTNLSGELRSGRKGFDEIGAATGDMQRGMDGLRDNVTTVSGYLDPLRGFVDSTADCPANQLCTALSRVIAPVDALLSSSTDLSNGAMRLRGGTQQAGSVIDGMPAAVTAMDRALAQARSATRAVAALADTTGPQLRQFTDYLRELGTQFGGSAAGGFYLPEQALTDPRFVTAMRALVSGDGRAAYLLVYADGQEWGPDGAARTRLVRTAVREATKEGTVTPTAVYLSGVGPTTTDLQALLARDLRLLAGATLVLIFSIMALMLRSPVAGLVVVGTVAVSFAAALGASVFLWQYVLGHELHWAVVPIALIALVAVGADYNLLLSMRLREEAAAGLRTGVIRAFGATGGTVTTAGIVFGVTMAALAGSTVLSVAQIGTTIAVGLMIDTLVIRAFVVPAVAVLLGRWFWWPIPLLAAKSAATRRVGSDMLQ
ncbi:MAG TPA: RND family transporter [Mycobacterium sp.]|nr:RND family transporter [Mycobacterium sp.]